MGNREHEQAREWKDTGSKRERRETGKLREAGHPEAHRKHTEAQRRWLASVSQMDVIVA